MRSHRFSCLSLLAPLLLGASLSHAQERKYDTLLLHFALDRYEVLQAESPKAGHVLYGQGGQEQGGLRQGMQRQKGLRQGMQQKGPGHGVGGHIDSVFIIGYTDKTGSAVHNKRLSMQRAAAAHLYIQTSYRTNLPVLDDNRRYRIIGGGVAPTPEQTDSANRRAEIVISYFVPEPVAANPPHPADPPTPDTAHSAAANPQPDSATHTGDSAALPGEPTAVISLQHVNFIADTPIPTDATRLILPKYLQQLRQYQSRRMEIDGYVNSLSPLSGPDDPLFKLSVKRAKFIYDYLVGAGFDPALLTYKGMGNARPVNPNPVTREEMDANMRVEIKVY